MTKKPWTERYKPAASASTHVLAAAIVWSIAGMMLLIRGVVNLIAIGPRSLWVLPLFLLLGLFKGKFVLTKSASRNVHRIRCRPEERYCLGGFMTWKAWLLVAGMIMLGRLLRMSPLPPLLVWGIYSAIGAALLMGSLHLWKAWMVVRSEKSAS